MSAPDTKEASVREATLREEDVRQVLTAELGHIESAVAERLASLRADYEERLRTKQEQWRREAEALEQRTRAVEAAATTLAQQLEALKALSAARPKRPAAERTREPPQPVLQSRPVVRKSTSLAPWLSDHGFR